MSDEKVLTFDDVDNYDDTVRAELKLFGGVVVLTSLNAPLMAEYMGQRELPETEGKRNIMLAVYSMLSPAEREIPAEERLKLVHARTEKLRKKNLDNVVALTKAALEVNGLTQKTVEARKND